MNIPSSENNECNVKWSQKAHCPETIFCSALEFFHEEHPSGKDILFYYTILLFNFYEKEWGFSDLSKEDILSFIRKHTLWDLKKHNYTITEETFKETVEGILISRIHLYKNPHMLMSLLE